MNRRGFLTTLGTAAALAAGGRARAQEIDRPNILFILTDDLGWGDPACFGHPFIKTPNIDRLAAEGTIYKQFYVNNPVCSPSRTAFMTGHYPARHHVHGHFAAPELNAERSMPNWLDPDVVTVPKLLKKTGYVTAHFGKWHLSGGTLKGAPEPSAYGFDVYRTANGPGPGWDEKEKYFRAKSTGLFVDETLKFIKEHQGKPFYVNLWTLVPHATLDPTPEELAVYADLEVDPKQFPGYMRQYLKDAPDLQSQMKVFAAAVTGMDKALGRLLDALDEMGLTENTLVLFSSDNGPEDYQIGNARNAGVGYPGEDHRGRKRSIYEGGVRTPCIIRWPGHIYPGEVNEDLVLTAVDLLPTVCAMTGVPAPESGLDGEDVTDMLMGLRHERAKPIYWEWRFRVWNGLYTPPSLAIRQGAWKFLVNADGTRPELYNIPNDGAERHNVAADHPELVKELKAKLLAWKETLPD